MNEDFTGAISDQAAAALRRFDEENSQDPNLVGVGGVQRPHELVYADWLTGWVLRLRPDASESLRLAARCQHLRRWSIPRASYPATRAGYLRWRSDLRKFHAEKAGEILRQAGCSPELTARVEALVGKELYPEDPEARVLEDALCLVFLERQFAALAEKSTEDKMVGALQKAWHKMTARARELALGLPYGPSEKRLLELALAPKPAAA